jgi:hypothetical protein
MKFMKAVVSSLAVAGAVSLTGCMTTSQADEVKVKSDAAIAAAQAETEAAKAEGEAALAQAMTDSKAALAQAEAEKAGIQLQLEEAMTKDASQQQAAMAIPGSTLTQNGTLMFTAEGQSVAVAADGAIGVAKARMAAETIAKANLLEIIKGGLISSSVSVGDMMFQSQAVSTTVHGWIGGVVLDTATTANEQSRLPDADPVDQIVTAKASLEISLEAWEDLQDYVE